MEELDFFGLDLGKKPAIAGKYSSKSIEEWKWLDFYNYFEDNYKKTFKRSSWENFQQRNAKKTMIESSYELRGKELLKAMIDWVFDNYKDYPKWNDVSIGLICGKHGWAEMISENAQKQLDVNKRWLK